MWKHLAPALLALPVLRCGGLASAPEVIDTMDAVTFKAAADKAQVTLVDGQVDKALEFRFPAGAKSVFAVGRGRGRPAWDKAAGISFLVKGDGSSHFGGLQFIWNENYALRYDYAFPISSTAWTKIVVPWRDLIPVLPAPGAGPIEAAGGNAPSKLGPLWFGKWWYWRDYGAHSYTIDEVRLESAIPADTRELTPPGPPLARVLARLKKGQPVTIVTMGDSLTDYAHWANKPVNWPTLLKEALGERFGSAVTIANPAIGGTQLRQNVVLLPRWIASTPEPDLVTVCFGFNDWEAGMRGPQFLNAMRDAVDRIRRATNGNSDVLLMSTCPALERWQTMAELADAVRQAARAKNAGIADVEKIFSAAPPEDRARLFARDKVHLSPDGHRLVVRAIAEAIGADFAPRRQ